MVTVVVVDIVIFLGLGLFVLHRHMMARQQWPEPVDHPFVCEVCNRGFKTGGVLSMHLRASHGGAGADANRSDGLHGPLKQRMDDHRAAQQLKAAKRKRGKKAHKLTVVK